MGPLEVGSGSQTRIPGFKISYSVGPPRGRGVRGASSKTACAGIPGLGPVPAKLHVRGAGVGSGGRKAIKHAYLDGLRSYNVISIPPNVLKFIMANYGVISAVSKY